MLIQQNIGRGNSVNISLGSGKRNVMRISTVRMGFVVGVALWLCNRFSYEHWDFLQAHLLFNTGLIRRTIGRILRTFRHNNVRKSGNVGR